MDTAQFSYSKAMTLFVVHRCRFFLQLLTLILFVMCGSTASFAHPTTEDLLNDAGGKVSSVDPIPTGDDTYFHSQVKLRAEQTLQVDAGNSYIPSHDHPHAIRKYYVGVRNGDVVTAYLFDLLGKQFNLDLEYVFYDDFTRLINDISTGKIDFTGNFTYSDERAQVVDISEPTNIEYTYLYTKPSFQEKFSFDHIHSIGISKGTIFKEYLETRYPNLKLVDFYSPAEAVQLLNAGKIDGIVDSITQLRAMVENGLDSYMLNDMLPIKPVGLATTKGKNQSLMQEMVEFIHTATIQKRLREAVEEYQRTVRVDALRYELKTSQLDTSSVLKVKLENLLQFSEYQDNGQIEGIAADILKEVCQILDVPCQVVSTPQEPWSAMYQDLLDDKIDVLGPLTYSEKLHDSIYFSHSFYLSGGILVKRTGYKPNTYRNVSELIVERIGVVNDDFYDRLFSELLPNKILVRSDSRADLIQKLLNDQVDYIVLTNAYFNQVLRDTKGNLELQKDELIGTFYQSNLTFGFPHTEQGKLLGYFFDRAMKIIDIQPIVHKYDAKPDWHEFLASENEFSTKIRLLLAIIIIGLFGISFILYRQSMTDNLTKLKNRRGLYRRYRLGIDKKKTIVYLDVNRFKQINDTYGHEVGDAVLKQVARLIMKHWPGPAFRIGGDEFVLMANIPPAELEKVLSKLASFTHYRKLDVSAGIEVSLSFGVSREREHNMKIDAALHIADQAMYEYKRDYHQNLAAQH